MPQSPGPNRVSASSHRLFWGAALGCSRPSGGQRRYLVENAPARTCPALPTVRRTSMHWVQRGQRHGVRNSDTNSFWGRSIHWNRHLETYVVLLNQACCKPNWPQEGIYISFYPDVSNPAGWTRPEKIVQNIGDSPGNYPRVLGAGPGETAGFPQPSRKGELHPRTHPRSPFGFRIILCWKQIQISGSLLDPELGRQPSRHLAK